MVDISEPPGNTYSENVNEVKCEGFNCDSVPVKSFIVHDNTYGSHTFCVCKKCFVQISKIQQAFAETDEKWMK